MSGGTIFAVCRTGHHVRMMVDAMGLLADRGLAVQFVRFGGNDGAAGAKAELAAAGWDAIFASEMLARVGEGDTVVFAVPAGLGDDDGISQMAARGVRFAHVHEGCRFGRMSRYHKTLPIPFLAWGPSALKLPLADVRVVGAPVFERLPQATPGTGTALINYKFAYREAGLDPEAAWLREAVRAAREAGFRPVVTAHPKTVVPEGFAVTQGGSTALMRQAEILISRASTVIYEALASGVQPFYFSVEGETAREFRWPRRGYPICADGPALLAAIRAWRADPGLYEPGRFYDRHVSRDPERPAAERMADQIAAIHGGPPLVSPQGPGAAAGPR